jgi:signal transduction histidine kinase
MTEEKRRESAGRIASAIALPEWSLRRKLALALTIPMLLAATFGGLRVHTELAQSDNYSATAKQVTVLRPAVGYLAAAERAIIVSRQRPALDDPGRLSAIDAVDVAGKRLTDVAKSADLTSKQQASLDSVMKLSGQLREGKAYISAGQAVSQVRQLQRGVTELIDSIVVEQIEPEPKLGALQQALDGRVSLAMQQYMVNVSDPKTMINAVDLAAELGVEQVIIDRLGSYLGTDDPLVLELNQQNAAHFGVIRGGDHDLGDAEAFQPYDQLSTELLNDIDSNLTNAAKDARGLAIANAVVTVALLLAAIFLALLVSRMLLNPIRRVREGALEIANDRLPEMVARIRAGEDPGEITPIPVDTHEEMGQLARAVDDMNRQAVHLASGEARLRSQVGEMFSTLSRRNTSLINQQLGLIERLEKDEEDPNRLESLFRLDHLASRMRRTADSLMVLADAPVQTSETDALALGDVFQAAMAGVQEYQRVQIESSPPEKVNGAASADVVHLMTELVDNALAFSPPTAPVKISTKQAGDSTIVEISDGGLGIAQEVLTSLNEDLRSGGEVTVDTARRMGLLVVSRLAKRHGVTVSLARNTRGGTTATVLLPPSLLRGQPTQVQPKQRPGLTSLQSVKPAAALAVEQITNEPDPKKKLPTRGAPVAPLAPAAPSAPAASAAPSTAPSPAAAEPAGKVDPIEAAINAVIRLPQRQPGATRTGGVMPGAPTGSSGGSLFQRPKSNGTGPVEPEAPVAKVEEADAAEAAQVEETTEAAGPAEVELEATAAADVEAPAAEHADDKADVDDVQAEAQDGEEPDQAAKPKLDLASVALATLQQHAEQRAGATLGKVTAPVDAPSVEAPVAEAPVSEAPVAEAPVAEAPVALPDEEPVADEAVESWVVGASSNGTPAPPPAAETAYDSLDSRTPMPEATEDGPIFQNLRSNWFTAGGEEGTWTTSEIEAGWEAAEQVAEAPTLQLSESGLPMRRPGKRLVPGGVTPAVANAASVNRDPEAIRARLAAHAAGVSRGRTAAVDETVTSPSTPSTEEGPA